VGCGSDVLNRTAAGADYPLPADRILASAKKSTTGYGRCGADGQERRIGGARQRSQAFGRANCRAVADDGNRTGK
jgi:hypothetical protein